MKYLLSVFALCVLSISCKQKVDERTGCFVEPRLNIKTLLDSFVAVTGGRYSEYAIYIDKNSPHSYDLIIYAGSESLTKQEDKINDQIPIQKAKLSNVEFKIYSGAEHYFQNTYGSDTSITKSALNHGEHVIWVVKDSSGVMTVYEVEGAYPFISLPNKIPDSIKFKLPVGDSSGDVGK